METYYANSYSNVVADSMRDLYVRFINFLPNFLVAVIILIVGWVVAVFVAKLVKQVLHSIKIDELGDKLGLDVLSSRTGMKMSVAGTIAWLVKWFLLVAIFLAVSDILGLQEISVFLNKVLAYIPNVIIAAAVLLVGTMVAQFVSKLVRHSVRSAGLHSGDMMAAVAKWAIMITAVVAVLGHLGIADKQADAIFTGLIYMLALAGGLAFGLGGKEHAARALDKIEKDVKS